jgi:hypothetical protein
MYMDGSRMECFSVGARSRVGHGYGYGYLVDQCAYEVTRDVKALRKLQDE